MMSAKWKRILSLVMSLLMMLPGSAFAQTGPVYSAEDQTALNGYIELLGDGFGLNELNADYAPFVEAFVRDEIELRNEDGGPLWQETENGWSTENTFDYAFTGEVGEDLAQLMDQLMLRLVSGEEGSALSVGIGEGEEYTLPMSNVTGHADVFAYAIGTAEAPKLMVGAIGADDYSNAVVIGLNAETGAWEIETQVTTIGDMVILNEDVANVQVDTDGSIWLTGETGAKIYVIDNGKSRVIEYNEYGDLVTDAGAPGEDGAEGQEDLAAALLLAARCSILWGEGGADSVSLKTMLDTAKCTFCGGEGQHLSTRCTVHCLLDGGDHGPCEYCGERKCNHKAHGEDEGECGYIGAGPSKAPVAGPTAAPGVNPTTAPTTGTETQPTAAPTAAPEVNPTAAPTAVPTEEPGIGGDAPDLPYNAKCEKCGTDVDSDDAHKAECGHWICAADWNDAEHVECEGCGEYDCAADYNPDEHYPCEGCGMYACNEEYDPMDHPYCSSCDEYLCFGTRHDPCPHCQRKVCEEDFRDYEHGVPCPGCGVMKCKDEYLADPDAHAACPSCGTYECEEGYDSYEHEICLCGEYRCAGPEHMPCPRCTVPPCSEDYGEPEDHAQCEICGAFACDYDYDPEDHTACDLCGLIKCDPDHYYIDHNANGRERCLCMLAHDYTTSSPVIGEDGDVEEHYPLPCCGKCAYEHNAEYHVPAACGKEGHRNCDRDLHEQCEGCGEWTCDEDFVWGEHDYCYNCEVYFCEEEYAHIIHYYYDDGDCRCTLRHDDYSAQPWSVGEEGVEAHFALDCCGNCDFRKHSGHGQPAECGKEGHIACTYGPHNVCSCGAKACDEGYYKPDHSLCFACGKRICNGANHSQAPCGHYYCVIGDSAAWHNGCSGCGIYACSGNYDDYTHNCPECGKCYLHVAATAHTTEGACGHTMCSIKDPSEHSRCETCDEYICGPSGKEAHAVMDCGHKACQPAGSFSPGGDSPLHTQICEGCGKYKCIRSMGGHSLYDCKIDGHWQCVGDYDRGRHEKLPCGVHYKCEVNESEWALHGACDGCGTKLCQIDAEERPLHEICTFCGLYLCSEDHFVSYPPECENPLHCGLDTTQHHEVCYGCGLYLCDPAAADLIHNTDACGHWTCTTGYVPAEHAYHEACGKFFCDGGNHEPCPDCGKCPEDRWHFICFKCGKHEPWWCRCDKYYCEDCYYSHLSTCPGFGLPLD